MEMVRDGKKVWPYCSECGCRLDIEHIAFSWELGRAVTAIVQHFKESLEKRYAWPFLQSLK